MERRDAVLVLDSGTLDRKNSPTRVVRPRETDEIGYGVDVTLDNCLLVWQDTNSHLLETELATRRIYGKDKQTGI